MFFLCDANNFYPSCHRVFRPDLEGKPIIVLSNNDGAVVARSNEAKSMGIAMGVPFFKIEKSARQNGIAVFSSNYALYGDVSRRITQLLANFAASMEIFSIDESFLLLKGMPGDLTEYALGICKTVKQWTGIPVSIGVAPTKTLAKITNRLTKKGLSPDGPVWEWSKIAEPEPLLAAVPVEDVWGISEGWGKRLRTLGIEHALALREANPKRIRQHFGVVVERIVLELQGVSCIPLDTMPPPRKQIMTSRSFGEKVIRLEDLRAAVTSFAARSGEKLRTQGLCARVITVFIHTSPFDTKSPQYSNSITVELALPSQDSAYLIHCAAYGLERIFRPGYAYQRAGVLLPDLIPANAEQTSLFDVNPVKSQRSGRLMEAIDEINRVYGRQTIRYASETLSDRWQMRQQFKSLSYTTRWTDLMTIKC